MPDLLGHRILRGFEELYYAVPTFVGMTARVCVCSNSLTRQESEPAQLRAIHKPNALERHAQNYLIAGQ